MENHKFNGFANDPDRMKYNTLTLAEAKKYNKFLVSRQPPTRTASVHHKPRPPPLLTSLDEYGFTPNYSVNPANQNGLPADRNASHRSSTICGTNGSLRSRRNSINYGRFSTFQNSRRNVSGRSSPNDSELTLSIRSSLDVADSAYETDKFQTASVDLGDPGRYYENFNGLLDFKTHGKLTDESYESAKSQQSNDSQCSETTIIQSDSKSKSSLSSATSRTLQDHLSSIKKLFRYMPLKRQNVVPSSTANSSESLTSTATADSVQYYNRQPPVPYKFSYTQPLQPENNHADVDTISLLNKCDQLERSIEILKDKLISKERELTELQLKQFKSDYLIDRLERENAQLKRNINMRPMRETLAK